MLAIVETVESIDENSKKILFLESPYDCVQYVFVGLSIEKLLDLIHQCFDFLIFIESTKVIEVNFCSLGFDWYFICPCEHQTIEIACIFLERWPCVQIIIAILFCSIIMTILVILLRIIYRTFTRISSICGLCAFGWFTFLNLDFVLFGLGRIGIVSCLLDLVFMRLFIQLINGIVCLH